MTFENDLRTAALQAVKDLFGDELKPDSFQVQRTKPEFEGDLTLVVFPLTRLSKKSPEVTGKIIGEYLIAHCPFLDSFNTVKGFLNLRVKNAAWLNMLNEAVTTPDFGIKPVEDDSAPFVIEYSSPNTNKPLHLGHVRNILLGWSVAQILNAAGRKVYKVNLINDRGIHICKSMLAWQKTGNGETPNHQV